MYILPTNHDKKKKMSSLLTLSLNRIKSWTAFARVEVPMPNSLEIQLISTNHKVRGKCGSCPNKLWSNTGPIGCNYPHLGFIVPCLVFGPQVMELDYSLVCEPWFFWEEELWALLEFLDKTTKTKVQLIYCQLPKANIYNKNRLSFHIRWLMDRQKM